MKKYLWISLMGLLAASLAQAEPAKPEGGRRGPRAPKGDQPELECPAGAEGPGAKWQGSGGPQGRHGRPEGMKPGGRGARGERPERPERGRMLERLLEHPELAEKLGYTPEDLKKLQQQRKQHEQQAIKLQAALEEARLEMREVMQDREASEEAIMSALKAQNKAQFALQQHRVRGMLKAREAFGPERAEKLREMMQRAAKGRVADEPAADQPAPKRQRPERKPAREAKAAE